MMSPSKNLSTMDSPAFAVYNSGKNKKNKNKKKRNKSKNSDVVIIENKNNGVNKMLNTKNLTNNTMKEFKKNTEGIFKSPSKEQVEVINIEDNSSDIFVDKISRKNKRKRDSLSENSEEIISDDVVSKSSLNGSLSNRAKKQKSSFASGSSTADPEISILESDSEQSDSDEVYSNNSLAEGRKLFKWLISPVLPEDFFRNTWEKRPLHIKRGIKQYYTSVITTAVIDKMLRSNNIQFTKNLDVTSYTNGKRETHNPEGRAMPSMVWDYYKNGCSIRLLNPQTFIPKLGLLNTTLQDYFGCFVGANAYLTPSNSQGFAPHYDDIEAFILQVEGRKHWRLYAPKSKSEILPRFSSGNFSQDEIGTPIMEVTLEPGDLLYFPRGTIHQANTLPGSHSLHLTLSCYQRNTWGDLLEKTVTAALRVAMEEDMEFRKGLPTDYLNYMGLVHSDTTSEKRTEFMEKIKTLMNKLFIHAPIDAAVDQMGKQFMHDALPPVLTPEEKECSALGDGYQMKEDGKLSCGVEFSLNTRIKLLRAHILRLVTEEDSVRIYHCAENSLEYHGQEPQFLEIAVELAPAVEHLIRSYPEFTEVKELPVENQEQKLSVVSDLWDRGLLLTDGPLKRSN